MFRFVLVVIVLFFYKPCSGQDTIPTFKWYNKSGFKLVASPTILVSYGIYVYRNHGFYSSYDSHSDIIQNYPNFHSNIDNVTQFLPPFIVFGLNAAGYKGRSKNLDAAILSSSSLILTTAIVQGLKYSVREIRPDGSAFNSFPSGHTATAFVGAEIMHQEYGYKSIWYSIIGYGFATFTGTLRMLNNRHWQSDVLVGAGIGIFSTKFSYFVKDKINKRKNRIINE